MGSVEEKGVATRTLEIQNYSDTPIQIKLEIEDEIKNGGLQIFYEGKATLFDGTCESTVEHGVSIYLNHVIVIHGHHLLKISLVFKPTAFGDSNGKLFIHSNENVSNVTIKMHGYCSGSHIRLKEDRVIYFEKKFYFHCEFELKNVGEKRGFVLIQPQNKFTILGSYFKWFSNY